LCSAAFTGGYAPGSETMNAAPANMMADPMMIAGLNGTP
jgi:hypothetical protein